MTTRPARVAFAAVLAVLTLGAIGCGSDGDDNPTVQPPATDSSGGGGGDAGGSSDSIEDGGLSDCGTILRVYASLATTAVRGDEAAAAAEKTLDGIKDDLPPDLQDDLAVVAAAFAAIAEEGVIEGASELTTSEFREANENILGYLREDCLPG